MPNQVADEVWSASPDAPAAPPDAGAQAPAGPPFRGEWVPDAITTAGGLICAAVGVAVMVAWLVRTTPVVRLGGPNAMTFNTALALAVTGAALVAIARGRPTAALAAGVFDTLLGAVVLAEYILGRGLGIDQLAVRDYLASAGKVPGRMGINTAVCLAVAGVALLVWGPWRSRRRPAVLAAAGSAIAAIAAVAAFGYSNDTSSAYSWGHLTAMSLPTAVTMLILALSLLSAAWRDSHAAHGGLPGWLPMPAGVLALGLGAVVWLAIPGRNGFAGRDPFTGSATVLVLVMAGFVALVVWLAYQADRRRVTEAARRSSEEKMAQESDRRLVQFMDVMPVSVFIASAGGEPFYANAEAERLLGRSVVRGVGASDLGEVYGVFLAGSDQHVPVERLPTYRAFLGQPSHDVGLEVHRPDGGVTPVETWGRPVYGADGEIEYSIVAFADMSERIAREQTIVGQADLLDLAHDAIFVREPEGLVRYWNTGAERTYGFTRAQAVGQLSHELLGTRFPEPFPGILATVIRDGSWDGELTQRCADGRSIIVESRWAAQHAPDGSLMGIMEINRDITARKAAERETLQAATEVQGLVEILEQRTAHLQQANKNIAAFTYSAAHDVRTPLRALSGFAAALVEDYGDLLDETGRGYAQRIQGASEHMGTVLDGLLRLSQVSSAEMSLQETDLSALVTAICARLRARDPGRQVLVTIQDGIRASAATPLIRAALEELLENAWKFTAGREHATIEFATTKVDDAPLCCYVRDNGAGFDPAYAGKLFQPFQRLHTVSEFPSTSTGTGLARVQRIIDRHGGRTWAVSAVGAGATFSFTLDAKGSI